ncbi:hypothetical protein KY290_027338 [Solanum tuberosum]|uniref:Uncharacterized protein n=1 Tax=Solanum tuberosum TaxID=4113 RepID=A0ABQ7UEN3_SOLTU|nr:hypothetical protein KY290_027338 [Solanum tuberosum]
MGETRETIRRIPDLDESENLHVVAMEIDSVTRLIYSGTKCNFIHCFRNPGGDYEWANLDKPPPRYWLMKMAALLGYVDESVYDRWLERKKSERMLNSYKMLAADFDRKRVNIYYSDLTFLHMLMQAMNDHVLLEIKVCSCNPGDAE